MITYYFGCNMPIFILLTQHTYVVWWCCSTVLGGFGFSFLIFATAFTFLLFLSCACSDTSSRGLYSLDPEDARCTNQ